MSLARGFQRDHPSRRNPSADIHDLSQNGYGGCCGCCGCGSDDSRHARVFPGPHPRKMNSVSQSPRESDSQATGPAPTCHQGRSQEISQKKTSSVPHVPAGTPVISGRTVSEPTARTQWPSFVRTPRGRRDSAVTKNRSHGRASFRTLLCEHEQLKKKTRTPWFTWRVRQRQPHFSSCTTNVTLPECRNQRQRATTPSSSPWHFQCRHQWQRHVDKLHGARSCEHNHSGTCLTKRTPSRSPYHLQCRNNRQNELLHEFQTFQYSVPYTRCRNSWEVHEHVGDVLKKQRNLRKLTCEPYPLSDQHAEYGHRP